MVVAVLGYNPDLSRRAALTLAQNDEDTKIYKRTNSYIEMQDGTLYLPIITIDRLRGYRFDQIILVDDSRWEIFKKRAEEIWWMKICLSGVLDGSEYEFQKYEW